MGNDLRRIADEVARIECEFEAAVSFTVLRDSKFWAGLEALDVRFYFVGWKRPHSHVHSSSLLFCRSSNITFVEMGRVSLPLASFIDTFVPPIQQDNSTPSRTRQHRLDRNNGHQLPRSHCLSVPFRSNVLARTFFRSFSNVAGAFFKQAFFPAGEP